MKKPLACLFLTGLFLSACGQAATTKPADSVKPSDQLLDNSIFIEATSSGNISRCKDILDNKLKVSCEQVINDKAEIASAVADLDKSKCGKISDDRYKKDCETQVDLKLKAKTADIDRIKLQQEAYDKKDYSICDKVEDSNQKNACMFNVITQLKDPSLCEKIGQKDLIAKCKSGSKN